MKHNIRVVKLKQATYLRLEDVVSFIREIAGTEETDQRNRLESAATELLKLEKPKNASRSPHP